MKRELCSAWSPMTYPDTLLPTCTYPVQTWALPQSFSHHLLSSSSVYPYVPWRSFSSIQPLPPYSLPPLHTVSLLCYRAHGSIYLTTGPPTFLLVPLNSHTVTTRVFFTVNIFWCSSYYSATPPVVESNSLGFIVLKGCWRLWRHHSSASVSGVTENTHTHVWASRPIYIYKSWNGKRGVTARLCKF